MNCCVPFCTSSRKKNNGKLSFHEFPVDQDKTKEWLKAISRDDFVPNTNSASSGVCSLHFKEHDYSFVGKSRRVLKKGSVPSVFPNSPSYKVTRTKSPRRKITRTARLSPKKCKILMQGVQHPITKVCSSESTEKPVFIKCEPAWPSDINEESSNFVCVSKSMEESVFVKCEPAWPSDIKEEPSDFEQCAVPFSDNQVNIKEEPCAAVSDPCSERVDINLVKESFSDEDEIREAHEEECKNSGSSSHERDRRKKTYKTGKHKIRERMNHQQFD
ncbi:peroxynitrite isomerase THAP4 isoform X2 [Anabrus simplex]|uniref:peroxynitrite isomerase THAP4 isoform X2 n=1 Tax=Anabrus simplex TaxID=316456 RepID=UPI0035A3B28D